MTSKHTGFSLWEACSSDCSNLLHLSEYLSHQTSALVLKLFGNSKGLGCLDCLCDSTWALIIYRRSFTAWTASEAWRPCKSKIHIPFFSFRMLKISQAAFALRLCAAFHSFRASRENCWAEMWSPRKKELVAALEWRVAALLTDMWEFNKYNYDWL